MKKVYQTDYSNSTGDCFRACLASILELPINSVPNFWKQTQEPIELWKLNNEWIYQNHNCKIILIEINEDQKFFINNLLCIAIVKSPLDKQYDHAVVWRNEIIHDPNIYNPIITEKPITFALLVPATYNNNNKETKN